jgi:prolyl oligopeptidase
MVDPEGDGGGEKPPLPTAARQRRRALRHPRCSVIVRTLVAFFIACAVLLRCALAGVQSALPLDPFLWLEDVSSPRALAWVRAENGKTRAVLERDPHFGPFYRTALAINGAADRIPSPDVINGRIYNFWQDPVHVRGIWRTTTIVDYTRAHPNWRTVLDLDALARREAKNWIWQGADCDSPGRQRCLISLSEGGEDASTIREFNLRTEHFVTGGFRLPRGKQSATWLDARTLLVAREWRAGDLTTSGYPFIVKKLRRGQPLSEALEITRGKRADVGVVPFALHDGAGARLVGIVRRTSFFETEDSLITSRGLRRLAVPLKARLEALVDGRLVISLQQSWLPARTTFERGSLVSVALPAALADPAHLVPSVIYAPGPRQTLGEVATTRDRLIVTTYDDVRGRAALYAPVSRAGWKRRALNLPDDSTVAIVAADDAGSAAYVSVTGYLTQTTLWQIDADRAIARIAKTLRPRFDASSDVAQIREATSNDGTRVPYFIVHPKHMRLDGGNPTILYGYGGFEVSLTPQYSGTIGKLWLERGGVYVVANIRGGGEFGPAWHEAALTVHRQRAYDDFAAVARDLIARRITSPRRLGIRGGSNGGLLMGVEFTQHPELWKAVDIGVPLLDMLRFEKIQAGASWIGEYGSVSNPAQRAFLASISPYNRLAAGVRYPTPLIWTTTRDDRVGPQHARKFAAKLAALGDPYFFYEVTEGGHGAGANIKERSFTTALEYTYFARQLMDRRS